LVTLIDPSDVSRKPTDEKPCSLRVCLSLILPYRCLPPQATQSQPLEMSFTFNEASEGVRYLIIGNAGTGKSTLAKQLGSIWGLPVLSLDTVFWRPGWGKTPEDEMQGQVSWFIAENPSWVIDGNYFRKIGTITIDAATDIIWLDPPFWRYYHRVVLRTFLRWIGLQETCAPGCVEGLREFYAADGIVRWAWNGHSKYRIRFAHLVMGDPRLKRFGGWGYLKSLQQWLAGVAALQNNE